MFFLINFRFFEIFLLTRGLQAAHKSVQSVQNEARGRENLFSQSPSEKFQSEKPAKPIFTQKLKSRYLF